MEYFKLNNGIKIPKVGYGVYQIPKEECEECVLNAIAAGYRLIDTAQAYFNEAEVGSAIVKCGVPRSELFITTKIWLSNYGYEKTKTAFFKSLEKLQTNYVDLVLLHQPFGDYYGAYHALEDLYKEGKIKAIGVSNFYPGRLADIAAFNEIIPQVNQIEINPFFQQDDAQANMEKLDIQAETWAPFGENRNNLLDNQTLKLIANKYNKTPAQIILRWLLQRNIISLAKTTKKERMQENLNIFDFALSKEDIEKIRVLDTKKSLFFDNQTPEGVELILKINEERKTKL